MPKYTTKPQDYRDCHPVIAEHLRRGEQILCEVWDQNEKPDEPQKLFVRDYLPGATQLHYRVGDYGYRYRYAEPVVTKVKRIMPPERAIPILIREGWSFNVSGDLTHLSEPDISRHNLFEFGKTISNVEADAGNWPPCIIEEVDEIS